MVATSFESVLFCVYAHAIGLKLRLTKSDYRVHILKRGGGVSLLDLIFSIQRQSPVGDTMLLLRCVASALCQWRGECGDERERKRGVSPMLPSSLPPSPAEIPHSIKIEKPQSRFRGRRRERQ